MSAGKRREKYLDALKVFALLMVFALHTQRGVEVTDPCHDAVFFYAARCGMPLLFMAHGSLILRREDFTWAYCRKKLLGIARLMAVWGAVTAAYELALKGRPPLLALKEGAKAALGYHQAVNLWFFTTFAILYLVLLLAFPWVKKNAKKLVWGLGAACALLDALSVISVAQGGFFIQERVTQRLRLWTWGLYFCLGYVLGEMPKEKIKTPGIYLAAAGLTAACVGWQYWLCWKMTGQIESNYVYDSLPVILWCACLFLAFRKAEGVSRALSCLAGPSFGAFLLHSYFIDVLSLRAVPQGPMQAFFIWATLAAGCFGLSYLLGMIPGARRALRY